MLTTIGGVDEPKLLLGAEVPQRRRPVSERLSQEHIRVEIDRAHGEIRERYRRAGGLPRPSDGSAFPSFGPAPLKQVRRVFVAKFNPAESAPGLGRFLQSDPYLVPELWDFSASPECWVSDMPGHTKWTPAHSDIDAGDLIFVFRSQPKIDGQVLDDATGLGGQRYLLGVWWVTRVHRRYWGRPSNRAVTDAWHVPLVRFDDPVHVRTIRRHPELADLGPFTDRSRATLVAAAPREAAALTAACSLPSWILTDPDPVDMARRLSNIRTGARPDDLVYRSSAIARYQYIHAIETAASLRVQYDLDAAGWDVVSREQEPGWGADLDCLRQLSAKAPEHRAVEVKGKGGKSLASVVLQASQYREALRSAQASDGEWWLVMCPQALHQPPPPYVQRSAKWVKEHWNATKVR